MDYYFQPVFWSVKTSFTIFLCVYDIKKMAVFFYFNTFTNLIHLVQLEKMKQSGRYASPRRTRSKGSPISSTHSSRKGSPSRSPQPEAEGADAAGRKGSILSNSTFCLLNRNFYCSRIVRLQLKSFCWDTVSIYAEKDSCSFYS